MGMTLSTKQTIAYDGNVAITNAFQSQTRQVRLAATSACHYLIGDGVQTAASNNTSVFLPANIIEVVDVNPGQRISAIKTASNGLITGTAGTLYVTEYE